MGSSLDLVPASVSDYRLRAERRLPRFLFDYVDGGAGAEVTLRANVTDFEALRLRQRVLRDAANMDTSVELFGERLALPLILAPIGMGGMMARRAEVQAKRAADTAGIPFCLSTVGICGIEEVAAVSPRPAWFQLYMLRDRGVVKEILDRVWAAGVRTLLFTVDLPVAGTRYRDVRNGFSGGTNLWGKLRAGPIDYLMHPHWLWNVGLRGKPHVFANIADYVPKATTPADFAQWVAGQFDPSVEWHHIEWLRQQWQGKFALKGILDAEDARAAIGVGADGIAVSNHGGRQLDGVSSSIAALPRVAEAVQGKVPLLVDGGVRCGQDLVKALALGASAAMIGRPWVYAAAAQGEAGLTRMLRMFAADMRTALGLTGAGKAALVGPEVIDRGG